MTITISILMAVRLRDYETSFRN